MSSDGRVGGRRDGGEELTVQLGDISPAGTRHMWQRSAVALADELAVVGAAGRLRGVDVNSGAERWSTDLDTEYVVSLATDPAGEAIFAGCRGENGAVAAVDAASGDVLWTYRTAADLGSPQKESLFFLPYVVDVAGDGERFYAAARRYERGGAD
ncbi:PQQ-binding-like beta-propeller repeat protein, partial [Natronoarchaeum mannanilyticum]